jgi:hypothetical protein
MYVLVIGRPTMISTAHFEVNAEKIADLSTQPNAEAAWITDVVHTHQTFYASLLA